MPELPEVEIVARQLAPHMTGRTVRTLRIHDAKLREGGRPPRLAGQVVRSVDRAGKQVRIAFATGRAAAPSLWLTVHLRMTGRLLWEESSPGARDHLRARFTLDRGVVDFVDTRRFGTFRWYRSVEETLPVGVEPLDPGFQARHWKALIAGSRQNIKSWLLRQDRVVGLGNIYASEILHAARVSPHREAGSLTAGERARIHRATRRILTTAIENCGTTFSDFQDARGVEGSYQEFLQVYARDGEPCSRCGGTILREVQQQRSTFYCDDCQS